mmetsp:Transcript_15761/g.23199  ORF Transcript_15761/g.23199 Transcript_15761/m.23199 type:complete len:924 (-) Transcript_15761:113-2884(-)|eukprot:CAMPEP_0194214166 /NCGR_PEP_ID=MMETSP0156-20130528/15286_1 /TAXON_ID=33649 /ORGANISM="Thalassionema nitzschioides, Strain L26-B" /LENGTH=923 /DNA_ID=CAMNT_0038942381 /DNA_START=49 /DNA_END=2820 /DNA_ORIENTATION=+
MDSSLIPAEDDQGIWDELNHQQTREIEQHLSLTQSSNFLQQTVESIKSVAKRATVNFSYKPVADTSSNLSDFGLNDEHLLMGYDQQGYEEFPETVQGGANGNSFMFLQQFRLPRSQQDGWGAVSNLDLFFSSLYSYYYHRGLMPILGTGIANLISLFVTLWLSIYLFAYIDWQEMAKCIDEQSCKSDFFDYVIEQPFSKLSLWNFIVILYCLLFASYSIFATWSFWRTLQDALQAKHFFEERLGIDVERLEGGGVDWDRDIVSKLIDLQNKGDYRITIHEHGNLDSLVIAQRIMRKENFMIAFFNRGMIDLRVPFLTQQTCFCKSLEWSIYFCVLNYMFNHKYQIRPAFYLDPPALRRRFILCGVAHAIFLPFLAFFMSLHFLMQNVYDWRSTKQYLGPKDWSLAAKWTFREFNELPHFFERRLGPSYEATEEYLKLFRQSELVTTVGRILAFVGGSFGGILLVFAAINDAILLHVKLGNFNLLWYVGMMGVLYSAGKSMLPNPDIHLRYNRNLIEEMDEGLRNIASHTHHYPETWKGKGYDHKTRKIITSMFSNKAKIFLNELTSLVAAPFILCYYLPRCAEHICEFAMTGKEEVPGVGDICGYATFDFDKFSDEEWEGKSMGVGRGNISVSVAELQDVEAATRLLPKPKAYHGKMEKSFFGFKGNSPSWKSTKSGQSLIDQVNAFKQSQSKAIALEQKQHLEAAARQLETLTALQQRPMSPSQVVTQIHESYIDANLPHQPDADSGGGGTASFDDERSSTFQSDLPRAPSLQNNNLQSDLDNKRSEEATVSAPHQPSQSMTLQRSSSNNSQRNFDATALSMVLSTELRRVVLDPDLSTTASFSGAHDQSFRSNLPRNRAQNSSDEQQLRIEHVQYLWLQRFHAHVAEQRNSIQSDAPSVHEILNASNSDGSLNESHDQAML